MASGLRIFKQPRVTRRFQDTVKAENCFLHPENSFIFQSSQAAGSAAGLILGRASAELPVRCGAELWCFMINRGGHPLCDLRRTQGKAAAA